MVFNSGWLKLDHAMNDRLKPQNVKEACIKEALAIVARDGIEHLSLREVARRLSISHQTPYRHFKSRDHLLAELVAHAYRDFANVLAAAANQPDPDQALAAMGIAYLDYAAREPLAYRLMFGTPLPPASDHPTMMSEARRGFDLLVHALTRRHAAISERATYATDDAEHDAMFIWSTLHGFASIRSSSAFDTLEINHDHANAMIGHMLTRIGKGIGSAEQD